MGRNKKTIFGANEKATNDLINSSDFSAPATGYPISFGKGEWTDGIFVTIGANDNNDSKVRFIWDVDDTNSGAIYAGNKLVSSRILDITTNATADEAASEIIVKFIDVDNSIKEMSFGVVDPEHMDTLTERFQALEDWAKEVNDQIIKEKENGAIDVIPSNNEFAQYELGVKVDDSDETNVSIVDDKITVSKYTIEKVSDASTDVNYSAQYEFKVQKPGTDEWEVVGDTINIFKDFVLKSAHVCTFNKKSDGSDWGIIDPTDIDTLGDVYAIIYGKDKEEIADVSIEVTDPDTGEITVLYLEKAPMGQHLLLNHTYLHLVVNTINDDEKEPEEGNDNTTDVYLDFTEIIGQGVFAELQAQVDDIDGRVSAIEGAYVQGINIPDSIDGAQFKTITVTTMQNGTPVESTFDIPDTAYYDQVALNFEILSTDCSIFARSLTWQGLE